jgi:hypothetical protein
VVAVTVIVRTARTGSGSGAGLEQAARSSASEATQVNGRKLLIIDRPR